MSKIAKYMEETSGVLHSEQRHLKGFYNVELTLRVAHKQPNPSLPLSACASEFQFEQDLLDDGDILFRSQLEANIGKVGMFDMPYGERWATFCRGQLVEVRTTCCPVGHVYFIRATDSRGASLVKIGHTGAMPYQRFYAICRGLPGGHTAKIECCLMFEGYSNTPGNHKSAERFFHRYFSEHRVGGEWFDIDFGQICDGIDALRQTGERIVFV